LTLFVFRNYFYFHMDTFLMGTKYNFALLLRYDIVHPIRNLVRFRWSSGDKTIQTRGTIPALGSSKVKSPSKRLRNPFIGFVIRLRRYVTCGIIQNSKPIRGRISFDEDSPLRVFIYFITFRHAITPCVVCGPEDD
jgi:hypothetical protein